MALGSTQPLMKMSKWYSSPVTVLQWLRGFQEVEVKQSRYRLGVVQRVPGS
jgi:hypothetical protein